MTQHANMMDRLAEAAIAYAEADSEDDGSDFLRKRDRLRKAAMAYALSTSKGPEVRRRMVKVIRRAGLTSQLGFWPRLPPSLLG